MLESPGESKPNPAGKVRASEEGTQDGWFLKFPKSFLWRAALSAKQHPREPLALMALTTLSNYLGLAMELLSPSLSITNPTQFLSLESFLKQFVS